MENRPVRTPPYQPERDLEHLAGGEGHLIVRVQFFEIRTGENDAFVE